MEGAASAGLRVNQDRHTVESLRRRPARCRGRSRPRSWPPTTSLSRAPTACPFVFIVTATAWGFSELDSEWSQERDRASHAVKTVRDNAALYQKADRP